ncbi:hypothetical protein BGZ61DRAFT_433606 [Ilyonectria robusta]|uniref:uncharacterized protein n=1 Tax=Ilyonectria robusta TaxID=1079257 RepID=UPI001E8D05B4|nr:uncharacterized protein BGZ61DRAFT_433606 [Ilyonectria robusta]KAH8659511.1 hypothetical protein BGZ61DRAFT_433606 [Ilyonectria robusta]
MPPKRKALEPAYPHVGRPNNAKKAKSGDEPRNDNNKQFEAALKNRSTRWAKVSGSKNLDIEYMKATRNLEEVYAFVCICNPVRDVDEEEDDDNADAENKVWCDKGRTCPCNKQFSELPSHSYTISKAGLARNHCAANMMNLRTPDFFAMYTFNDHAAYGALEVVQNLLLDFDEAFKNKKWQEAWSVVEAMAIFVRAGDGSLMFIADEGQMISETASQIARMVLAALAALESDGMLSGNSHSNNAGWMIAMYIAMAAMFRDTSLIQGNRHLKSKLFKFWAGNFDLYLRAIAHRLNIAIPDTENASENIDPTMPKGNGKDPWGWARSFAEYKRTCVAPGYAFRGTHRRKIGGDGLDISTWSSAERKQYNFDNKDPLPRKTIESLGEGLVLVLG